MYDKLLSTRRKSGGHLEMRIMTVRVHELATDLGLSSARVLELLLAMSLPTKGPSSSVEPHHADAVRQAYEAMAPAAMPLVPEPRPTPRHQRAKELLYLSTNGQSREDWLTEQALIRRVNTSRQEAAAKSRELYEADQATRREADRRRWEGSFEGPREPKHASRAIVYQGGAPGLGKRH